MYQKRGKYQSKKPEAEDFLLGHKFVFLSLREERSPRSLSLLLSSSFPALEGLAQTFSTVIRERNSAQKRPLSCDVGEDTYLPALSSLCFSLGNDAKFFDTKMLNFLHDDEHPAPATAALPPRETIDETLLRAPEFSTDEFRIYKFKVREENERVMLTSRRTSTPSFFFPVAASADC